MKKALFGALALCLGLLSCNENSHTANYRVIPLPHEITPIEAEGFCINGEAVAISDYLVDSPYLISKFGSGKFDYTCKDFTVTQWTYPASV